MKKSGGAILDEKCGSDMEKSEATECVLYQGSEKSMVLLLRPEYFMATASACS